MSIKHPPADNTVEDLHGRTITDPYRPLENLFAPATQTWAAAQTEKTELEVINPITVQSYTQNMKEVINFPYESLPWRQGDRKFFLTNSGLQQYHVLMVQENGRQAVSLLDPNTWPVEYARALQTCAVSPDGNYMAYMTSERGEDWTKLQVMDVNTGEIVSDGFRPCRFSSISWKLDSKGFVYSAPTADASIIRKSGDPQMKIFDHRIGTDPVADTVYYDPPASAHYSNTEHLHCSVCFIESTGDEFIFHHWGTKPEVAVYWRNPHGELVEILGPDRTTLGLVVGRDGYWYGLTSLDAPRGRIVRIDPSNPESEHWLTIVPQHEDDVLQGFMISGDQLLVKWKRDVAEFVESRSKAGELIGKLDLPSMSSISLSTEHWEERWIYINVTSHRSPSIRYVYDSDTGDLVFHSKSKIPRDLTGDSIVVEQVFATSKDGTRVPMTLIYDRAKVKLDGTAATKMYGYGGFGMENNIVFDTGIMHWVEQGGIYVDTNIRGGGEYGRDWHRAAIGRNKQKSYDDFIACAEYLIAKGYTMPCRLGITGSSNGGLLVLACAVQRPDLFGAVRANVAVTDMLRFHTSTAGSGWVSDYGDPNRANDFDNLLTISPLHNLRKGKLYPRMLLSTGDHDDRVEPWHSYKFVATMNELSPDTFCYLHVSSDAGHGGSVGLDKQLEFSGKMYSFWEWALGPINRADYELWKIKNPDGARHPNNDGRQVIQPKPSQ